MLEYLTHTRSLASVAVRNDRKHHSASGGSSTQKWWHGLASCVSMVSSPRERRRGISRNAVSSGVKTTVASDGPVGTVSL
jgi:hypothetical protein